MKRRIVFGIVRLIQWVRIAFYNALSTNKLVGKPELIQPALMIGDGVIEFQNNVKLGYFPSPFFLNGCVHLETRGRLSSILFGEDTHVNNNFVAIAEHKSITIGKRCFIGTNVEIYDSDFHGIKISERRTSAYEKAKAVAIGDDVFIGSNVKIMKGSVIGDGAVIANGAVVFGDIPASVIAGGNPAKVLKAIEQ